LPFPIAPRAGALADRVGERPLILAGTALLAAGMAWLTLASGTDASYPAMVAPMTLGGIGFSLALPAVTKSVVSLVSPQDIGRASGTFSTVRQLGGALGVAILGAVFATAGGYQSPAAFSGGYAAAIGIGSALAAVGVPAALTLPGRRQGVAI
jgi:MFS family permease